MPFLRSQLRLSYIADEELVESDMLYGKCKGLLEAGVTSIHLRYRRSVSPRIEAHMAKIIELCQEMDRYCFVEDNPLLAMKLSSHGVTLSQLPKNPWRIRELMGVSRFIGVHLSHEDLALLEENTEMLDSVDFVGIGPVLQFGSKRTQPLGIEKAHSITRRLSGKPVFWSGGIQPDDISQFGHNFADGITVSRCLEKENLLGEVQSLHSILARTLGPSMWSVGHFPRDLSFKFSELTEAQLKSAQIPLPV